MNPNITSSNNDEMNDSPSGWEDMNTGEEGTGVETTDNPMPTGAEVNSYGNYLYAKHQEMLEERGMTEAEWVLESRDGIYNNDMDDPLIKQLFTEDGVYDEEAHKAYAEKQAYGHYGGRDKLLENVSTGGETGMEGEYVAGADREGEAQIGDEVKNDTEDEKGTLFDRLAQERHQKILDKYGGTEEQYQETVRKEIEEESREFKEKAEHRAEVTKDVDAIEDADLEQRYEEMKAELKALDDEYYGFRFGMGDTSKEHVVEVGRKRDDMHIKIQAIEKRLGISHTTYN